VSDELHAPRVAKDVAEYLRGGDVALPEFDRSLRDVLGSKKMCCEDVEAINTDTKSYMPGL
jgi:hypothetical protein